MKIILYVVLFPCVLGAYHICSDNTVCPEGTKCCTTYDNKIRCCDEKYPDSIFVKTTRSQQVVPSTPLKPYLNSTQPRAQYSCMEKINCHGTCCDGNCCPYKYATCCEKGCCSYYSTCCEGYTKFIVMKRWCCVQGMNCGDADNKTCLSKGLLVTPHFILVVITATVGMCFLKIFS